MSQLTPEQILALANDIAEVDDDMNEAQIGGGFEAKRFAPGWTLARFTSYIEKGKHVELFQGKAKDPALRFTLGFEFFSPNYLNDDGTPYFMETFDMSKSRNEKARAFKLFKAMNYKGLAKVFPQLLNGIFLVEVKDYLPKNAKPGQTPRSVIGEVSAGIDRLSGQEYQCPPASKLFLFSWAKPSLEAWDSFHIDGLRDDGTSKNWKQEEIAGATDFPGSPLEALLLGNSRPIPKGKPQKTGAGPAAGAAPAGAVAPVAAAVAPAVAPQVASPNVAPASNPEPSVSAAAPAVSSAPAVAVTAVAPVVAPVVQAPAVVAPAVTAPAVVTPNVVAPAV